MQTNVHWKNKGLTFTATSRSGFQVDLASALDGDTPGFRPMELMATGIAGCTAMDVLSILRKKRQEVTDLEVQVKTENLDQLPRIWTRVEIKYLVTGRNIDPKAVERAIELSSEKYCPAQNMIKQAVDIHLDYQIIEAQAAA